MLREPGTDGETLAFEGLVLNEDCRPVTGAVIDIWHCDEYGRYDNRGFRYRGHQVTDATGAFRFLTIRPGHYTSGTWISPSSGSDSQVNTSGTGSVGRRPL